jgi:hypothetical protein
LEFAKHRYSMVEPPDGGVALEKQNPPAYRFESVAHWLSAFHIFVSIYCEKYSHEDHCIHVTIFVLLSLGLFPKSVVLKYFV